MHQQSCIIIDDEAHALATLADIVDRIPGLILKGRYGDGLQALEAIREMGQVDFVFSDVEMPQLSGIEAASLLKPYARHLVFTTAHARYALDAYGVEADAFLLKPLSLAAVLEKVESLRKKAEAQQDPAEKQNDILFLKTGNKQYKQLHYADIICVDAGDHYHRISTVHETVLAYHTMNELEERLRSVGPFVRIHKSHIISLHHLDYVDGNSVFLKLEGNKRRDIGESYRKGFFAAIEQTTLNPKKKN